MSTYVANVLETDLTLPTPVEFFTYGSPKVFDSTCLASFQTRHHRFVNCNDVVAHVPMLNFEHYSTALYISSNNTLPLWGSGYSWLLVLDMLAARWRDWMKGVLVPGAADHATTNYIRKIDDIKEPRLKRMGRCHLTGIPLKELGKEAKNDAQTPRA
jgi:hypothetical protein